VDEEKSKHASLAQQAKWFWPHTCAQFGETKKWHTSAPTREDYNKYDLTSQSYYDWSRWFAFSNLHLFGVLGLYVGTGVAKK
jgi:hypothetical protein